jgi:HEAT repeat protein
MSLLDGFKANKAIDILLESDNPRDPDVISATSKLKQIGKSAVPKLIDALLDAPGNALIENLLLSLLDNKSLPEYLDALTEPDRHLVQSIAKILITSNKYDCNNLLPQLDDPEIPKKLLMQILTAKKDQLNPKKVIALLESEDKNKRLVAFHLIQHITSPEVIPYLLPYAEDPDTGTRINTLKTLAKHNHNAVKNILLKSLSDPNKLVRQTALESIAQGRFDVPASEICPLLRDPDMKVQASAIDTLVRINDQNIVIYLIDVLNDESEYIRRAAVEVLNEIADSRAIKNLLNAMRDTDWWVRVRAADALGSIGGPRVVEAVLALLKDKDEFMRRTAVEILNSVKDERAYFYLTQALDDDDWWVRERAVDALGQLGDVRAIPELMQALDKYPESAHVLVKAILQLGGDAQVEILIQKANQVSGERRKEILLAVSEHADAETIRNSNASMEDIKTKIMESPVASSQTTGSLADNTTLHNTALPGTAQSDRSMISGGIVDLSESDAGLEIAHVLDASKFTPGYIIANRYKMLKQIGKGAFGVVVLVEDMMVNDQIILKFLNAAMSSDENIIQRFIHELRYARKITHENIIRIYDFITFGKSYAISMEYFDSHSLAFEMKTNKKPNIGRMLKIFGDICMGVGYAHSKGVVHRDLKPANILIDDDDEVKIVDFGLAAAASSADSRMTRTGILVGTPTYMAPEQVRARAIDQRTDIYSLGILLYELFVGKPPYKGEDHLATLFQHVEGKAVPANVANPKIPEGLNQIIMKTMSLKPEDRYQTAEELAEALSSVNIKEVS